MISIGEEIKSGAAGFWILYWLSQGYSKEDVMNAFSNIIDECDQEHEKRSKNQPGWNTGIKHMVQEGEKKQKTNEEF